MKFCILILISFFANSLATDDSGQEQPLCGQKQIQDYESCVQNESATITTEYLNGQALCRLIAQLIADCQTKSFVDCITDDYNDYLDFGWDNIPENLQGEMTKRCDETGLDAEGSRRKKRETPTCSKEEKSKNLEKNRICEFKHYEKWNEKRVAVDTKESFNDLFNQFCKNNIPELKECLEILKKCHNEDEIGQKETEIEESVFDLQNDWVVKTTQLQIDLPDLKPCFKFHSGQSRISSILWFNIIIATAVIVFATK